jgi:threonine/homoserine/homoserine lactone efflux protein
LPQRQSLPIQLVRIFVVFLAAGMPCPQVWAFICSGARRLFRSRARVRAFNIAMGVLLITSVVPVLLESW